MKYCQNCGRPADDRATACPVCRAPFPCPAVLDSGHPGWGFLAGAIPVVGLILYLTWKDQKPKCAKCAKVGTIIGFIIQALTTILGLEVIYAIYLFCVGMSKVFG